MTEPPTDFDLWTEIDEHDRSLTPWEAARMEEWRERAQQNRLSVRQREILIGILDRLND